MDSLVSFDVFILAVSQNMTLCVNHNKSRDQIVHMHNLVSAFTIHIYNIDIYFNWILN